MAIHGPMGPGELPFASAACRIAPRTFHENFAGYELRKYASQISQPHQSRVNISGQFNLLFGCHLRRGRIHVAFRHGSQLLVSRSLLFECLLQGFRNVI